MAGNEKIEDLKRKIIEKSTEGRKFVLEFDIGEKRYQIGLLKKASKGNFDWVKFIEDLHIRVNVNGKEIPVTRDNVSNFKDSQDLIKYRIKNLEMDLKDDQKALKELDEK